MTLIRFWFDFDLDSHRPPDATPGTTVIDGGTVQYRWLCWGAGVTAHDDCDALEMLRELVEAPLPPVADVAVAVDVGLVRARLPGFLVIGNPALRGVWFPSANLRGSPS